jgi:hypothetical protein
VGPRDRAYADRMTKNKVSLFTYIALLGILGGCSAFGIRSGYEQVKYTVKDKLGEVEVRQYPSRLVAEVDNMKDDNEAFMALFRYISGQNSANDKIAMTTPVEVSANPENIAMTAPVETLKTPDGGTRMRFFLPSSFTVDTAPKPNDPRIRIFTMPEETFAAITYSGFRSKKRFQKESDLLVAQLASSSWKAISPVTFLGYDPPFTIPFLRRNEAVVKVESRN